MIELKFKMSENILKNNSNNNIKKNEILNDKETNKLERDKKSKHSLLSIYLTNNTNLNKTNDIENLLNDKVENDKNSINSISKINTISQNNLNTNNKIDELISENINLLQIINDQKEQIEKLQNIIFNKNKEIEELKEMLKNKNIDFINERNNLIDIYNKTKYNLEESRNEISIELKTKTNQLLNLNKINIFNEKNITNKNILLSELESKYNIIKNKYELQNKQTDINNKKHIEEINILQKQISHLNSLNNEKDLVINDLKNENKLLKNKLNSITYDYNFIKDENKLNKENIKRSNGIISEKNTENKRIEIEYGTIINDYKYKEHNYLLEIKNLKNKIYDEENKCNNLNNEIKKQSSLNQKLLFDNKIIIEESYNYKNRCNKLEKIIQNYKNTETELNKEREIIKDNIDYIKKSKINEENERLYLLEEIEKIKKINIQLIKEKNILQLDSQNKDITIKNYETDIENINENIENIKNKMKKINNITYLTKGFQLYLSQRINKKRNKTENIFLYLTSSSMEIENLINNLKLQEGSKNRLNKEILNMKTDIDNYQKNENKLKTMNINNQKSNIELEVNLGQINNLLNIEKECNNKYKEKIKQDEFIISEACVKSEYLEKINNYYVDLFRATEEIIYNLSNYCKNKMILLYMQQFLNECNKIYDFKNNIYNNQSNNLMNIEIIEQQIGNSKRNILNIINNFKQQIIKEQKIKENKVNIPETEIKY